VATILKPEVEDISFDTPEIARVTRALKSGDVIIIPTETVYGLAADVFHEAAVQKIFAIKKRSPTKPVAVLVAGTQQLSQVTSDIAPLALKLANQFWPGPLTLIMRGADRLPQLARGKAGSVGVRCPAMALTRAIIKGAETPLAATSANLSGGPSPTMLDQVNRGIIDAVTLAIDGGPAEVGIESTVLDITIAPPQIIRPGAIEREVLEFLRVATGDK